MSISLAPEIHNLILRELVADGAISDSLDEQVTTFHDLLPPYPSGRSYLAAVCARVSQEFYDRVIPVVWEYLVIRNDQDLDLLLGLTKSGVFKTPRRAITDYTLRIDVRSWTNPGSLNSVRILLNRLPNVRVLAFENHKWPSPNWRHPEYSTLISSIPNSCPQLRRLQFLAPELCPTLSEIAYLSVHCRKLVTLQLVNVNDSESSEADDMDFEDQPGQIEESEESEAGEEIDDRSDEPRQGVEDGGPEETRSSVTDRDSEVLEGGQSSTVSEGFLNFETPDEAQEESEGLEEGTSFNTATLGRNDEASPVQYATLDFDEVYQMVTDEAVDAMADTPSDQEDWGDDGNEDDKELEIGFLSLRSLTIGMGEVSYRSSEGKNIRKLIELLEEHSSTITNLEDVNVYVPIDRMTHSLPRLHATVHTAILHMTNRCRAHEYHNFKNLRRLVLVVYSNFYTVPPAMHSIEQVDILLRRPAHPNSYINAGIAERLLGTASSMLAWLLRRDCYPNIQRVVVWKTTPYEKGVVCLSKRFTIRYQYAEIDLQFITRPSLWAVEADTGRPLFEITTQLV